MRHKQPLKRTAATKLINKRDKSTRQPAEPTGQPDLASWEVVRDHFEKCVKDLRKNGKTQQQVAADGGLSSPNVVSKILGRSPRGPTVETFMNAIAGLGMRPSEFFRGLEEAQIFQGSPPPPATLNVELLNTLLDFAMRISRMEEQLKAQRPLGYQGMPE